MDLKGKFLELFKDKYIIRYRNDELIAYYAGQKLMRYYKDHVLLSDSTFNIPRDYVKKDINDFFDKAKKDILDLNSYDYKVTGIIPKYARSIPDKDTSIERHKALVSYFESLKDEDELGLYYNLDDINNIILKLNNMFNSLVFNYVYPEKGEPKVDGKLNLNLCTDKYHGKDNELEYNIKRKYIMLEYDLINLTITKNPYKRIGISKTTGEVNPRVLTNNDDSEYNKLINAIKVSIEHYNNNHPGGQKEKMFQDYLMHQDTINELVHTINKKYNTGYKLTPLEEEFVIMVDNYNSPTNKNDKEGRIDNVYFNHQNNTIQLMEVKINSTVILEKDTGIASHLKDMCMWMKDSNNKKRKEELNNIIEGINVRNNFYDEKILNVKDDVSDYLIICGYENVEERKNIITKVKEEEDLIKGLIKELSEKISTHIYLIEVKNENSSFKLVPSTLKEMFEAVDEVE